MRRMRHLGGLVVADLGDRKSTRLNSSHANNSYAVFCLTKKLLQRHALSRHAVFRQPAALLTGRGGGRHHGKNQVGVQHRSAFFFFNDTATTEIYTLSLHDALPI